MQWRYYLADRNHAVRPGGRRWRAPLPRSRNAFADANATPETFPVCYGDYFEALTRFLDHHLEKVMAGDYAALLAGLEGDAGEIFLEKHGAFYHPSRVVLRANDRQVSLAVNVALSAEAMDCLQREVAALRRLAARGHDDMLPCVLGVDMRCWAGKTPAAMFLAPWFDGFHEFHLARPDPQAPPTLRVWDPAGQIGFLDAAQSAQVYAQAAFILTRLYDPQTFEQAYPWHHAAGDFVVCLDRRGRLRLKLITVRRYAPMFDADPQDPAAVLHALLMFLVNMSIRTRLDRLDGVGDVVWAHPACVAATIEGFSTALALMPPIPTLPAPAMDSLQFYITTFSREEFLGCCREVLDGYAARAPEKAVVQRHLAAHAAELFEALQNWASGTT